MTGAETSFAPRDEAHAAVIDLDALCKSYHEKVAVDRLTFAIARGSVTGLLGGNGAGNRRRSA